MGGAVSPKESNAGVGTLKLALEAVSCKESACSTNNPQPHLDPPKSEWHDSQSRVNEMGKYSLLNIITTWRSWSGVPCGCVRRTRLWPLRRDDRSGVLIGADWTQRYDWPARVLANDVSTRIDR